jgi:Ni/Co efflux regulator RcnB
MKTTMIASVLIALGMAASGSAFAQNGGYGNDHNDRGDHDNRGDRGDRMEQGHDREHHDNGRHEGQQWRGDQGRGDQGRGDDHRNYAQHYRRDDMRGGGPRHDLRRGQRLSQEYRDNRYVVNDWRARRLNAPPRGQHWVQAGNDYVLAAIATGVITQVFLSY